MKNFPHTIPTTQPQFVTHDDASGWQLVANLTTPESISAATVTTNNNNNNNSTSEPQQQFLPCNNPENLIDETTRDTVEFVFNLAVLSPLELFGITTNIINCIVFSRQGLKDRINLCLFCLAVADMSFLLSLFSARFFSILGLFDQELEEYWRKKYFNIVLGPMFGTMTVCNLMVLIISVERCICVLFPFRAKRLMKTRHMLVMIVTMSVCVLGIYSMLNFKYDVMQITVTVTTATTNTHTDPSGSGINTTSTNATTTTTNATRWVTHLSDLYLSHRLVIDVLYNHLLNLTMPCLALVVVVVATSLTVGSLNRQWAWRRERVNNNNNNSQNASGVRREMAVTKMLVVVCFIYVTTVTPSVAQRFVRTFLPGYAPSGKYCNTFMVIQTVTHVCEVANSSFNFLVYYSMGSRFRSTLRALLPWKRGSEEKNADSSSSALSLPTISRSSDMR